MTSSSFMFSVVAQGPLVLSSTVSKTIICADKGNLSLASYTSRYCRALSEKMLPFYPDSYWGYFMDSDVLKWSIRSLHRRLWFRVTTEQDNSSTVADLDLSVWLLISGPAGVSWKHAWSRCRQEVLMNSNLWKQESRCAPQLPDVNEFIRIRKCTNAVPWMRLDLVLCVKIINKWINK